ncbi:MAG TPA: TIR domain-containing protein, partial [Pyrinomonadaceae bacterium]
MWLRSKLTSLSDYLFKSLFRVLFRYDIFISYARGDGKDYAIKLRDQLKHLDFSCFLDLDELPPGNSLNNTLKRAIRKSATLVIVGTERAVKSNFVELEVAEFAGTGRAIVPIDIDGSMTEAPWSIIKERDIVWIDEAKSSLTKGVPSPNVADSIDKLFKYTRRNTRVRAQVLSTIALFVVVVIAALLMIRQQITAKTIAFDKAEQQQIVAEKASAEAKTQKATAVKAIEDATKERERADIALANAKTAEKAAEEAAKNAKKQEAIARINAELAKKQQLIAEERTNYLRAKQIGVQADIDIDKGDNLERSVLLSVESLKTALTPDGYIAWARGMDLLPQPVETKFRKEKDDVTAIAYSPDGRFFAQGTAEGRITFFRTEKSEPVERHLRSPIKAITFGKNWVAAANEREFVMWDLDKFVEIRSSKNLNGFRAELIAFSPDGRYVATAGPSTKGLLSVFDTANSSIVIRKLIEHVGYIMSLSFSP